MPWIELHKGQPIAQFLTEVPRKATGDNMPCATLHCLFFFFIQKITLHIHHLLFLLDIELMGASEVYTK